MSTSKKPHSGLYRLYRFVSFALRDTGLILYRFVSLPFRGDTRDTSDTKHREPLQ